MLQALLARITLGADADADSDADAGAGASAAPHLHASLLRNAAVERLLLYCAAVTSLAARSGLDCPTSVLEKLGAVTALALGRSASTEHAVSLHTEAARVTLDLLDLLPDGGAPRAALLRGLDALRMEQLLGHASAVARELLAGVAGRCVAGRAPVERAHGARGLLERARAAASAGDVPVQQAALSALAVVLPAVAQGGDDCMEESQVRQPPPLHHHRPHPAAAAPSSSRVPTCSGHRSRVPD